MGVSSQLCMPDLKEKNSIEVMILWNEEHIDEGQLNPTKQLLRKASWNNTTHVNETWQEEKRDVHEA
jgi:hypothetical protein